MHQILSSRYFREELKLRTWEKGCPGKSLPGSWLVPIMRSGPLALPSTLPDLTPAHLLATVLPAFHAPQASSHGIPARTSPPAASFPSCPSESFFPPSYPGGIRCGLSLFFSQRQPVALTASHNFDEFLINCVFITFNSKYYWIPLEISSLTHVYYLEMCCSVSTYFEIFQFSFCY